MKVEIKLDPDTGKYVLEDKKQAQFLFDAIMDSFSDDDLINIDRCPMCNKKTEAKLHEYKPTKRMIKVLFEMRRLLVADPEQNEFVFIREFADTIIPHQALYSMTAGAQQNHKMCYLGIITQIDPKKNPVSPGSKGKLRAAYKITEKGMALLRGEQISPWSVHRRLGRTIITEEDKASTGTIFDARDMSYDDYIDMCKNAQIEHLKLPETIDAEKTAK